jgi:hypothetical protein
MENWNCLTNHDNQGHVAALESQHRAQVEHSGGSVWNRLRMNVPAQYWPRTERAMQATRSHLHLHLLELSVLNTKCTTIRFVCTTQLRTCPSDVVPKATVISATAVCVFDGITLALT